MEPKPVIFHIDVNSAFLSWSASYRKNVLGRSRTFERFLPSWAAIRRPDTGWCSPRARLPRNTGS